MHGICSIPHRCNSFHSRLQHSFSTMSLKLPCRTPKQGLLIRLFLRGSPCPICPIPWQGSFFQEAKAIKHFGNVAYSLTNWYHMCNTSRLYEKQDTGHFLLSECTCPLKQYWKFLSLSLIFDKRDNIPLNITRCALGKSTETDINCRLVDDKQYKIV